MSWRQLSGGAKAECLAYAVIALVALVGTQGALVSGIRASRMSGSQVWYDLTSNPTAIFTTIDLFMVFLAAFLFMIVEGRRLALRWWPLYPLLAVGIGVSFGFPLFLIARRLRVARAGVAA
ncbi:MAG TPA: DUF2834 domain-containing protein [Candidatus Limnocylindria bacterium]|nr:DUF2834 domain-containing protein [Candidatus Limnocylindria bacterium]